jgi:hypothetical protein
MPANKPLNDLQLVILSKAAAHRNGALLPFPATVVPDKRTERDVTALLRKGLVAETPVDARAPCWRSDGVDRLGLTITQAGLAALGIEADTTMEPAADPHSPVPTAPRPAKQPQGNRRAQVLGLLQHADGVTLAALCETTGWQPHSARAYLTGLRRGGYAVSRERMDGISIYRCTEQTDAAC